jgi:hypothetical protein
MTAAMAGAGVVAAAITLRRGDPPAVPLALGYFAAMEALQFGGYLTLGRCGTPANEIVTFLSILHIVFQPFFVNAFAMSLAPAPVAPALRMTVWGLCGASSVVMLLQLYPFAWAGACAPGATLCGAPLCTAPGDWHIAWNVPYNGLLAPFDVFGWGFPTYVLAAFGLPLLYGAWRFSAFHALAGPILAGQLTTNPNEVPAIWCLFSIGILLIALSPWCRRQLSPRPAAA